MKKHLPQDEEASLEHIVSQGEEILAWLERIEQKIEERRKNSEEDDDGRTD